MNKRLDYLDIAKGMAIFLVVMGHAVLAFDTPYWRLAIYAFHMPLFFLVSGTVTKARETYDLRGYLSFAGRNLTALMIPYLIWALIYLPFKFESIPYVFYGSWAALDRIGTSTALWYLPCLFLARMGVEAVNWAAWRLRANRTLFALALVAPAFAVGFLLPRPEIGYPWGANTAFIAAGFILLGFAAKGVLGRCDGRGVALHLAVFVAAAAAFVRGTWMRGEDQALIGMFCFSYGDLFWFFWNAVSGCLMTLSLSSLIAKVGPQAFGGRLRRFLVWLGRNTIGVYLLHLPIVRFGIAPALDRLGLPRMSVSGAFVSAVITLAICCALMWAIERVAPVLFGRVAGAKGGVRTANAASLALGEEVSALSADDEAFREMLATFRAGVLADGKVDFGETLSLLRIVGPVAKAKGGVYADFRELLLRTRADGVITESESAEIAAALDRLCAR